ncbi:glycosyltransferase 61 family protein [Klebsiella pneumoniae]|uniref:glycosyltransferase 61 family protein n=1 Tax=Klebsiella pneumoniae TaxID=573 RepID=UPI001B8ADB7D|nr:glycosyltransferase 61 family protein [Klebsiella pneumoniae]MBQ5008345.1 glycosyltransferase family 61 protein [Klebsiella pneumoniae]
MLPLLQGKFWGDDFVGIRPKLTFSKQKCKFFEYDDVIVLPHQKSVAGWGLGGVIDSNGQFIENSGFYSYWVTFGGKYNYKYKSALVLDEEFIWLGIFTKHWGHFLVDNISRLWFLTSKDYKGQKILYVSKTGEKITGNYLHFLTRLGIKEDDLVLVDDAIKVKKIIIPDYAKTDNEYHDEYINIFETALKFNDVSRVHNYRGRKVYFTRRYFPDAIKKERGENIIEYFFSLNGFDIIRPECLSLDEQIAIWSTADVISCINGTIPLNICFCGNNNPELLILNKTSLPHENLDELSHIFMKKVKYIDVYIPKYDKFASSIGDGPFVMCISSALREYAISNNMLLPKNDQKQTLGLSMYFFCFKRFFLNYCKALAKRIYRSFAN